MTEREINLSRYHPAELMRIADAERAKYLRALFKRLYARWSGRRSVAGSPQLGGAKA